MDKRKYFNDLKTLYEAAGMTGNNEVVPQENIADTGNDLGPQANQQVPMNNGMESDMGMNNIMTDPMASMQEPTPSPEAVMEKEKFKKLFELFEDLINYGTVFSENIKFVDISLLDFELFKKMKKYADDIKSLTDKINSYLINIFNSETYEKVLYSYILFRTELLTAIKGLRDILELNKPDEPLESNQ